ncbi:MAG: putative cytochrome [Actinomycetia bacterium]|nr:putative cytochrome [Actinomycetes bacterium]
MTTIERPDNGELTAPLDDDAFYAGDPFALYAQLRREAPVAWNSAKGYWVLTKHADVLKVSKEPETFCSGRGILTMEIGFEYASPPTMMHTDPPAHARYRKLVQPGFGPSRMRALEARVRERARELVAKIEPGTPIDFVPAVAVPFPLFIIAELLGVPEADWERFYRWSEAGIPGEKDWPPEENLVLLGEMNAYLLAATKARRGEPDVGIEIVSVLANVESDGEQLSDDELAMFLGQLLIAGNETTRNTVSGGIYALAENPEQWQRLVDDRSLVEPAIEEMLRWTTPVIAFMRTATRDTVIRGQDIAAGDPVLMLYASANRDEDEFGPTADRFDVGRTPNHHVAFGFGAHFCLGAALARLEIRALLDALLDRFGSLEPAGPAERTRSAIIAGVKHAPVTFS